MIESLTTQSYIPKRDLLVVGGGVAGMTAAISVANQGFGVHLVEKTDRLGGSARQVKETVEGYRPQELLDDLERQIENDDRITRRGLQAAGASGRPGAPDRKR